MNRAWPFRVLINLLLFVCCFSLQTCSLFYSRVRLKNEVAGMPLDSHLNDLTFGDAVFSELTAGELSGYQNVMQGSYSVQTPGLLFYHSVSEEMRVEAGHDYTITVRGVVEEILLLDEYYVCSQVIFSNITIAQDN
jgi:hypothetical protein